jgi:hypothetical protein
MNFPIYTLDPPPINTQIADENGIPSQSFGFFLQKIFKKFKIFDTNFNTIQTTLNAGITINVAVTTPTGTSTLHFTDGILTSIT